MLITTIISSIKQSSNTNVVLDDCFIFNVIEILHSAHSA